jgi:tRNA nucleotidyltransferase (CCA-adding enzyme)
MATSSDLGRRLRELPAAVPLLTVLDEEPGVHVVGGAVRDLLLGGAPVDLDLVVEGDAGALAQRLADALPAADLRVHDRFGTATVLAGGHAYDVVRARSETYARPGALPDVRPGTLEEDLLRRDFAANAIAVTLGGKLRAAPHALDDLAARRLRVLHDRSFLDDPTRLLRLVRYATRLGFAVEPETARLAEAAVAGGALATVTGPRIGSELRMLLREPSPVRALAWVATWADGDAVLRGLEVDAALAERARALLPADGRQDLLLLAGAAREVGGVALGRWLDDLGFTARERDTVVAAAGGAARAASALGADCNPSEIATALRGAPPELAALAGAVGGPAAEAAARRWLDELRHVRLEIHGDDLLATGVPQGEAIGRGLAAALRAKLDGEAQGRAAELAAALAETRGG